MINIKEVPRKYMVGVIGALVVILLVVTLWQPTNFGYKDKTDYADQIKQAETDRTEYEQLLASINVTQKDSEVMMKKIATEDVVKQEVNDSFQTNQKIVIPDIPDSQLAIEPRSDKDAVVDYFTKSGQYVKNYNARMAIVNQTVFTDLQSSATLVDASKQTKVAVNDLKKMPVPQEAVAFHKAQIVALQQYDDFLNTAQSYNPSVVSEQLRPRGEGGDEPWPNVYRNYAIINAKAAIIDTEFRQMDQKYSLSDLPPIVVAGASMVRSNPFGIKEAHALFGVADTNVIIANIPELILYGVKQALLKAFSTFIIKAIDKLVSKIDKYFTITSQLYYSQELGKLYTKEYWKKFNVPLADQNILANFIPDYFCVPTDPGKLKQIFEAKSKQLLKYDIKTIALNSDNFYSALAELGSAAQTNPEAYWTDYYAGFAAQSKQAAADAATKEVTSPGVKSGRDLIKGTVDKTLSKVLNVQEGSVSTALNLGNSNSDNIIATLIAGIFESITTKFIFTAVDKATGPGSGLAVVEESNICLGQAKYKPVVPGVPDPADAAAAQAAQLEACRGLIAAAANLPPTDVIGNNSPALLECRNMVNQINPPPSSPPSSPPGGAAP